MLNTQRAILLVRGVLEVTENAFLPETGQSAGKGDAPLRKTDMNQIITISKCIF